MKDKDGYLLLEKEFTSRGFNFKFIKDFKDGWMIYEKSRKSYAHKKYELIKPKRQDEYVFNGKKIEAKWLYPNDNSFGHIGFDCSSLAHAEEKHEYILENNQKREEIEEIKNEEVKIPTRDFTIKEFMKANPRLSYGLAYVKVKELIDNKEIRVSGVKENKRGRASNLYSKR